MHHYTIPVPEATCSGCWGPIRKNLESLKDIKELSVSENSSPNAIGGLINFKLSKQSTLAIKTVIKTIASAGFDVKEEDFTDHSIIKSLSSPSADDQNIALTQENQKQHLKHFIISAVIGLPLLILSAFGIALPLYAMWAISALSCTAVIYTGWDLFKSGIKSVLSSGSPTMHTLFTISVFTAVSVSIAALFIPMLPFEFASALLILSSHHIGKYIETKMKQQVGAITDIKSRLPATIQRRIKKEPGLPKIYEIIEISDIKSGDELLLQENDYLPTDGTLITKRASFKKTFINGNLLPETVNQKEKIYAGTQVMSNYACFCATSSFADSSLSKWEEKLEHAQKKRTNTQIEDITQTIIEYFIPGVLIVSVLTFSIAFPLFGPMVALHSAIAILVGACPCTLGFITPLAVHVGRQKSKEHGAIINNRETIEVGSKVTHAVIDLNGTLTLGEPKVDEMIPYDKTISKDALLQIVSLMENALTNPHPIGNSLKDYADNKRNKTLTQPILEAFKQSACGINGTVNHDSYLLGNDCYMSDNAIKVSDEPNRQYLAKNGKLMAYFNMIDPIRADAQYTIQQLQNQRIQVIICSGASETTVKYHAEQLNISRYYANYRSDEKSALINQLKEEGHTVAMIGDGINDLIALNAADVGIALANADEFSKDAADVIIRKDSLLPVALFFKNCLSTLSVIKQNLCFSFIYNLTIMGLTMTIALSLGPMAPAIMALSMGLQSLLILANTYRLKQMPLAENQIDSPEPLNTTSNDDGDDRDIHSDLSLNNEPKPTTTWLLFSHSHQSPSVPKEECCGPTVLNQF